MLADGARGRESRLAVLADGLVAAGQSKRVDGQLATDGASQLRGDVIGGERSGVGHGQPCPTGCLVVGEGTRWGRGRTNLMISACISGVMADAIVVPVRTLWAVESKLVNAMGHSAFNTREQRGT